MVTKKTPKGLGKGLSALLPDAQRILDETQADREQVLLLAITLVEPHPEQPRRHFDAEKISELSRSIVEHGLLQPLIVQTVSGGKYRIIAGERRWRAAQEAGLKEIPCIVRTLEEQQIRELSLIENIQREDLLPLEEAIAYRNLLELYAYTQELLAERLGKSRSHIANTLRLLTLAPQYQDLLQQGILSAGHARALLSLDSRGLQDKLAALIIEESLSVRQAEQWVKQQKEHKEATIAAATSTISPQAAKPADPLYLEIARKLKDKWGVKVAVNDKKGRGQIVIDYYNEHDLQRILDSLLDENL
jgi:ParB family chromosome partitioning protein